MIGKKITLLIFIIILSKAFAADVSLKAYVDRSRIGIDEEVTLSIEIHGTQDSKEVDIEDVPGFDIISRGSSSNIEIINGTMNASYTSTFVLHPTRIGELTIPRFKVQLKGTTYTTDPIKITVTKDNALPSQDVDESGDLVLLQEVANKTPFINEAVLYKVRFLRKVTVEGARFVNEPKLDQFLREDLGKDIEYTAVINGERYQIYEIKKIIFPIRPGKVTIPPVAIQGNLFSKRRRGGTSVFDSFFDSSFMNKIPKIIRSKSVEMEVKSLPQPVPSQFNGFVGKLSLQVVHDKDSIAVGDSVNVKIIVHGEGNLRGLQFPELKDSTNYKVYADKPSLEMNTNDEKISGTKTFTYALVPLKEDNIVIPKMELSYFDTETKKYVTLDSSAITITVKGGQVQNTNPSLVDAEMLPEKHSVAYIGKDIFSIHTQENLLSSQKISSKEAYFVFCFFLAPGILSFSGIVLVRKRRSDRNTSRASRRKNAYKVALKKLSHSQETLIEYEKILKGYCGDIFNCSGSSLTHEELIEKLIKVDIDKSLLDRISFILEGCEKVHYGLSSGRSDSIKKEEFIGILKQLDKKLINIERSH